MNNGNSSKQPFGDWWYESLRWQVVVFYSGDLFSDFDLCICHQYFIQRPNLEMGKNTGGQLAVSGGKLWCSTLGTGRRTPSTPSSPSLLAPQIFSENQTCHLTVLTCFWPNWLLPPFHGVWWLFSLLMMLNMMCPVKRVVVSMAALQMALPLTTLGPGADNFNFEML